MHLQLSITVRVNVRVLTDRLAKSEAIVNQHLENVKGLFLKKLKTDEPQCRFLNIPILPFVGLKEITRLYKVQFW